MDRDARIFVAGHGGLAGSAIVRRLEAQGYRNVICRAHSELDLANSQECARFFERDKPEYVFLAAARVGGIAANQSAPAQFISENLAIQLNVIDNAWRHGVTRLVFLGSSCIYPRDCEQPIREQYLMTGRIEPTNQAYALAKIAGIEMCGAYNEQYGTQFVCTAPTNLYGVGDNYDLKTCHVLPALIRKAHEAKQRGARSILVWGTGRPRRELMLSDDLADACVLLACTPWERLMAAAPSVRLPLFNVGTGRDISVAEIAAKVLETVGFDGTIEWDASRPDGTPRKVLDVSRIAALGWRARMPFHDGIAIAYSDYLGRDLACAA
jgi:GDP-L-fucose synthase